MSHVGPLPGFPSRPELIHERGPVPTPLLVTHRSFERQYIIPDNRVLDRPRPELWATRNLPGQVYVIEQHSKPIRTGPGLVFSALVPDMDAFKGSEGGRVLPLLRGDGIPNLAPGLIEHFARSYGLIVTPEDVLAYIAGLTAHPAFTEQFADDLRTPGIRVPLTADRALWCEALDLGREVVWAQTFGERFAGPDRGRPAGNVRYPSGDVRRIINLTAVPVDLPKRMTYDESTRTLSLDEGAFAPVDPRVWMYDVGGMNVLKKWFSYRKQNPGGRRSSTLDGIRDDRWLTTWTRDLLDVLSVLTRLVELEEAQADLLERVLTGPLISVTDLRAIPMQD